MKILLKEKKWDMLLINVWDISKDFIEVNPQFKVGLLSDFYSKSKNKKATSNVLWAVAYVCDRQSIFFNWTLDSRIKYVKAEILKDEGVDFKKEYKELMDFYNSLQETPAMRQLKVWNEKMDEKTDFISKMKYNIGTFENIEKMLSSNVKLYADLERIQLALEKEGDGSKTKGNWEESLSEKDAI